MEGHDAETNMSSTHTGSHVKIMVCFIRLRLSSTFSVQGKLFKFASVVLAGSYWKGMMCHRGNQHEYDPYRFPCINLIKKVSIFYIQKSHDISLFLLSASLIQVVA